MIWNVDTLKYDKHTLQSYSNFQNSEPRLEIISVRNEFSSQTVKFPIEVLREEIKPVVCDENC